MDPTKFKPEMPASRLKALWGTPAAFSQFPRFFFPIERLSVTKTAGLGRTNAGSVSVHGRVVITLAFQNVPPAA